MNPLIDSDVDSLNLSQKHFTGSLRFPVIAVFSIWLAHFIRLGLSEDASDYGIIPRTVFGLRGIVTAPLVHGGWAHLLSNTLPLFVLSALVFYFYKKVALRAFWIIYFLTGILVWIFARMVSHVGASGVVYGLVSFLFWNGIFRRSARSIILALVVLFFYSGMFMGILPNEIGVSWESHLLGSISGVFAAFWFKSELEDDEVMKRNPYEDEQYLEKQSFLPPAIFDKTKAERRAEAEAEAHRLAHEAWLLQQQSRLPGGFWNQSNPF